MAREVIKKIGSIEPFDPEKIRKSIAGAAQRTTLPEARRREVVEEVTAAVIQMAEEKETIATRDIREKILNELDRIEPSVAVAWRKYGQEVSSTLE